ncbi:hypothetical protein VTK73DRAFT_3440 [Phialemonium thermophilum]|uniref:Uncharacterized protein n=1 Tax=Phialemonium thermophilum TaxID=223376 RepID=A0ABR3VIP4_9PEZI
MLGHAISHRSNVAVDDADTFRSEESVALGDLCSPAYLLADAAEVLFGDVSGPLFVVVAGSALLVVGDGPALLVLAAGRPSVHRLNTVIESNPKGRHVGATTVRHLREVAAGWGDDGGEGAVQFAER